NDSAQPAQWHRCDRKHKIKNRICDSRCIIGMTHTLASKLFTNFVSMKENEDIERNVKLDYKGRVLEVLYHIDLRPGYGGLPYFSVIDKNKHYHHFIRGTDGIWHPNGRGPKWPKD